MSFNSLAATAAVEGKMSKGLKTVLKKVFVSEMQEQLAVLSRYTSVKLSICNIS